MIDVMKFLVALLGSSLIFLFLCPHSRKRVLNVALIFAYHFLLSSFFYFYALGQVTDSSNYYNWSHSYAEGAGLFGSSAVIRIVYFLRLLGLSEYVSVYLVFTSLSAMGSSLIYISLSEYFERIVGVRDKFLLFLMLLPGLHFWTGAVGKDSMIVFLYGVLLYFSLCARGDFIFLVGVVSISLIRPHIGMPLIAGLVFFYAIFCARKHEAKGRVLIYAAGMYIFPFVLAAAYYFAFSYIQRYSSGGFDGIYDFVNARSNVYADEGSGFDANSYPFWVRFFLVLLGGIPWRVGGIVQAASMLEGGVVLFVILWSMRALLMKKRALMRYIKKDNYLAYQTLLFMFFYWVSLNATLAVLATNFGLISRQRVMLYVPIFFIFLMARSFRKKRERRVDNVI